MAVEDVGLKIQGYVDYLKQQGVWDGLGADDNFAVAFVAEVGGTRRE